MRAACLPSVHLTLLMWYGTRSPRAFLATSSTGCDIIIIIIIIIINTTTIIINNNNIII